jgi:hypothetical protein
MKSRIFGLLAVGLLGANTANASPLRLDATSTDLDHTDFFVVFDDAGDQLLQVEEVTSFSGVTILSEATTFSVLLGVPTIADVSSLSGFCPLADRWCFLAPSSAYS